MSKAITGGVVRYLERVKTGDYEHREGVVELSFGTADEADPAAVLLEVSEIARERALGMVGKIIVGKTRTKTADAVVVPKTAPPKAAEPVTETPPPAQPVADPAAMVDETPAALAPAAVEQAADPAAMVEDDTWTGQREVTDRDLTSGLEAANTRLIAVHKEKGTAMLRELIAKYVGAGKPVRAIEQAQRQKFLDEMALLK